jgi:predicted aconitase with swiveling domain
MNRSYRARKVVRGKASAEAIVCPAGFSFMGDVDMATSEIVAEDNPNRGQRIKDKILIYRETKGSSGGCVVLMTLARQQLAPAAIVTVKPADYNMTEGAILARVPFLCSPDGDVLNEIKTGQNVRVDADDGCIDVIA